MFEIDLKWPVASRYVLRRVGRSPKSDVAIYPADDAAITLRRPLEQNPGLYAEFAALDGGEQACLQFAHKYGLLVVEPHSILDPSKIETLSQWGGQIQNIRDIINRCEIGRARPAEAFRQFENKKNCCTAGSARTCQLLIRNRHPHSTCAAPTSSPP